MDSHMDTSMSSGWALPVPLSGGLGDTGMMMNSDFDALFSDPSATLGAPVSSSALPKPFSTAVPGPGTSSSMPPLPDMLLDTFDMPMWHELEPDAFYGRFAGATAAAAPAPIAAPLQPTTLPPRAMPPPRSNAPVSAGMAAATASLSVLADLYGGGESAFAFDFGLEMQLAAAAVEGEDDMVQVEEEGEEEAKPERAPSAGRSLPADEKRAKRLERNRESARQSRRRKKQYLDLLEARVSELHRQIASFRSSHAAAADETLNTQRSLLLQRTSPYAAVGAASTPEVEAMLSDAAAQLVDRFGPNAAERCAVRDFHFNQLQRLLLPPHTKFLLWLVHQPGDGLAPAPRGSSDNLAGMAAAAGASASSAASPGGSTGALWGMLCSEIGLSNDQSDKLRASLRRIIGGPDTPRETWRLGVASAYLARLRAALTARAAAAQSQLEALKSILTPAQLIRYLAWVDANAPTIAANIDVVLTKAPV